MKESKRFVEMFADIRSNISMSKYATAIKTHEAGRTKTQPNQNPLTCHPYASGWAAAIRGVVREN